MLKAIVRALFAFMVFGGALFILGCVVAFAGAVMERIEKENKQ